MKFTRSQLTSPQRQHSCTPWLQFTSNVSSHMQQNRARVHDSPTTLSLLRPGGAPRGPDPAHTPAHEHSPRAPHAPHPRVTSIQNVSTCLSFNQHPCVVPFVSVSYPVKRERVRWAQSNTTNENASEVSLWFFRGSHIPNFDCRAPRTVYVLENRDVVAYDVDGFSFSVDAVECVFAGIHQQSARRFHSK